MPGSYQDNRGMAWSKEEILALAKIRVDYKVKVGRFAGATMDNLMESNKVSNIFNILVNLTFFFLRSLLSSCPGLRWIASGGGWPTTWRRSPKRSR